MKSLDHYLGELLLSNDCVVVPSFGGFVGNFRPSSINPVRHGFHPPSKAISFNRMLLVNDGLLAHHISLSESILFAEALGIISDAAKQWNAQIDSGNTLELKNIGRIFKDREGNFQFSQEGGQNFLIASYGLTSFQAIPVMRHLDAAQSPAEDMDEKEDSRIIPSITRMAKYSVAAALLSVAVLTAYKLNVIPGLQNAGMSFNFLKTEKAMYSSRPYPEFKSEVKSEISLDENEISRITEYNAGIEGVDVIRIRPDIKPVSIAAEASGDFHIVAGCFSVEENAQKLMERLREKGYDANASLMQGRLRVVTYGSFADRAEAREFLKKVKTEENNEAWLLTKKI